MRNPVRPLLWLSLSMIACGDGSEEEVDIRATLDSAGGDIEARGVRLSVPADALAEPVEIAVRTLDDRMLKERLPERTELASRGYELTPHGQRFEREVELEFAYEAPADGETRDLRLARLDDADDPDWEAVRDARFEQDVVVVRLDRFSVYAVVACEAGGSDDCGLEPGGQSMSDAGSGREDASAPTDAGSDTDAAFDGGRDTDAALDGGVKEDSSAQPEPARLSVTPSSVDFGSVALSVGTSQPVTLRFLNEGGLAATGCAVVAGAEQLVPFNDTCSGGSLQPGASCTVDVRAEVSTEGSTLATVDLQCDADVSASVDMSVEGAVPSLRMTPAGFAFGPVEGGTTSTAVTFTLQNEGPVPATGCLAPLLAGQDPGSFSVQSDTCGSADLGPGASCTVSVVMAPSSGDTAERRATLQRTCTAGGTASTDAGGLVGNRPHYLFVTSTEQDADFGGLAGADAFCQSHADAGTLTMPMGRTWKAFLSTSSVDARDRINWQGPVFDVRDLFAVANPNSWPWALDGTHPVSEDELFAVDESGAGVGSYVWTGSTAQGVSAGPSLDCGGWMSNAGTSVGQAGSNGLFPGSGWLQDFTNACDDTFFALICVSDYP